MYLNVLNFHAVASVTNVICTSNKEKICGVGKL